MDLWLCFRGQEQDQVRVWMTEPNGKFFQGFWSVPLSEDKVLKDRHQSWKRKAKIHRATLKGQDNIDHHIYIAKHSPVAADTLLSILPVDLVFTSAHFSQGYLLVINESLLTNEQEHLLTRFAKVFELTYQRFLDLKKAEAQALEARIEMALERVRARTSTLR